MSAKRNIVIAALGLAAAAGVAYIFLSRPSGPKGTALATRERAMEMLGARIAKLRPNAKVLVLSNPFTKKSGHFDEKIQFERAGISGLRKGLGGRLPVTVVFPEIKPEYVSNPQSAIIPPDSRTPLSFLMQPASVDQLADAHPECDVIVSLIGLPVGIDRLKIWDEKDRRAFALLLPDLRVLGPPASAVQAFERGKLLAAVGEESQNGDSLIVTRENVAELLQRQPKSLGF